MKFNIIEKNKKQSGHWEIRAHFTEETHEWSEYFKFNTDPTNEEIEATILASFNKRAEEVQQQALLDEVITAEEEIKISLWSRYKNYFSNLFSSK